MDIKSKNAIIMMATYNGEKYLKDQIVSLQKQTFTNWVLYVSDDGSTDNTVELLKELQKKDDRIKKIIINKSKYHGAFANYFNLMRYVQKMCHPFDYYFYCDQDDIWENDKMYLEVKAIDQIEKEFTESMPAFCYCDLELYSADNRDSHDKMSNHIRTQFVDNPYNSFFKDQYVWGTTISHNYAMWKLLFLGTPSEVQNNISHDVYLSKYAMTYAKIVYIPKTLVRYRRTGNNVSDTPGNYGVKKVFNKLSHIDRLVNNAARNYWGSLYFAYHAPIDTTLIQDVKECFKTRSCIKNFFKKYNVLKNESFLGRYSTKLILYSRIYKLSHFFKKGKIFK